MIAPDLSKHFGWVGELWLGLFGLFLLALMHKGVRRFAMDRLTAAGTLTCSLHRFMGSRSAFYKGWAAAFRTLLRTRRGLFFIVFALTAFDDLAGWHSDFILERFNLYPNYESYEPAEVISSFYFSAQYVLTLLGYIGYTLFSWIAFRVAMGASYKEASEHRPFRQLFGLFFCIYGVGVFAETFSPYFFIIIPQLAGDQTSIIFPALGALMGIACCTLGASLLNIRIKGVALRTTASALFGYFLAMHLLDWLYFFFDRPLPSMIQWLRITEAHASNLSYTLLSNALLVAFAIRLASPASSGLSSKTNEVCEGLNRAANTV